MLMALLGLKDGVGHGSDGGPLGAGTCFCGARRDGGCRRSPGERCGPQGSVTAGHRSGSEGL